MRYDNDDPYEHHDPAIRWLKKYTHQGLDKWPSETTIETLMSRFSNDNKMVVYRGMNFRTKDTFDKFMSEFKNGIFRVGGGISSWSPDEGTAEQFAIVQPTYFPDKETFEQEKISRENCEKLRGYRGIVLKTIIPANSAIDLRKSNVGHECELLLLSGKYKCEYEIIKSYRHQIEEGDVDINRYILSLTSPDYNRDTMMEHIRRQHLDKISEEAKTHLFELDKTMMNKNVDIQVIEHEICPLELYDYEVRFWFPMRIFNYYEMGLYGDREREIRNIAKKIYKKFEECVLTHPSALFCCKGINKIAELAGKELLHNKLTKKMVKEFYDDVNEKYRGPTDRKKLDKVANVMQEIFKQMNNFT